MKRIELSDAIKLRDSYAKEIENIKVQLAAVEYLHSLVSADIRSMVDNEVEDVQ